MSYIWGRKQLLARAQEEAEEEVVEVYVRWKSYLGLSYAIGTDEGNYNLSR